MARLYFLYRSKKESAYLKVRLQLNSNREQFEATTKIRSLKGAWTKKRNLSADEKNSLTQFNVKRKPLEDYIYKRYEEELPDATNKQWLKNVVNEYYEDKKPNKLAPENLVEFIDYYIDCRKEEKDIKERQIMRINTTKNKLIRLQKEYNTVFRIKNVNEDFKTKYIQFSTKHGYSLNTQSRELDRIKTFCRNARKKGVEVYAGFNDLKIKAEKTPKIYLTTDEIEEIKKVELEQDYLNNARNWLLISIYTGQRISDFMRFTKDMIVKDENKRSFIKFEQRKTGKDMYIPISKELKQLLTTLSDDFPRPISDQKYNDYIKIVCKEAKINQLVSGKKRVCIAEEGKKPTKNDFRNVLGDFPKWELVSSHIGRRTFATNNYGKIPTPYLIYITGHHSEAQFLNYIVLPDYEKAAQAFDYFN